MKDKFIQVIKYITQEEDFSNVQLIIYLADKLLFTRYTKIIDNRIDVGTSKFCLDYYNYWSNIQQHLKK